MRATIAIDGSPAAATAVELLASMPWPEGSVARVVRVVPGRDELFDTPLPVSAARARRVEQVLVGDAQADVDRVAERLRSMGLRVERAILRGRAAAMIVEDSETWRPDLIVVGTRRHTGIDRLLLGSVSTEVVDHAPVPVLVARKTRIDTVIVATDGSDTAEEAVTAVRRWPTFARSAIRVISVAHSPVAWWPVLTPSTGPDVAEGIAQAEAAALSRQREIAHEAHGQLWGTGQRVDEEVRLGHPATEIVAAAAEWPADLIVLGSHGRSPIARLLLGSVARAVLHRADCSVLIVRRRAETVQIVEGEREREASVVQRAPVVV